MNKPNAASLSKGGRRELTSTNQEGTMAKSLDDLLKLKGVIAAGEFSSDGKLIDYRGRQDLPQDVLKLTAQFAAAVTQMLAALGAAHTKISGLNWIPERGWAYSGGDMTIAVGGNR